MQNIFFLSLLAFSAFSCTEEVEKSGSVAPTAKPNSESKLRIKQEASTMITVRGTIRYKNVEGGFWGIEESDGNKYMPSGLSQNVLIEGMVVEVTGVVEEDKDLMTFRQYGKTLKVQKYKIIDSSKAIVPNSY